MTNQGILNQALLQINKNLKVNFDSQIVSHFIDNCILGAISGDTISDISFFRVAIVNEKCGAGEHYNRQIVSIDIAEKVILWYFKTNSIKTALQAFAGSTKEEKIIFLSKAQIMCFNQKLNSEKKIQITEKIKEFAYELEELEIL